MIVQRIFKLVFFFMFLCDHVFAAGVVPIPSCKIHVMIAPNEKAQEYYERLNAVCTQVSAEEADVIIVLGGDGFMLDALHRRKNLHKPFYGINCGTVGYLMNQIDIDKLDALLTRLQQAHRTKLTPIKIVVERESGHTQSFNAINDVTILRQSYQSCRLKISVNGQTRISNFSGDGIIVSTSAGSTAYNSSAGGPIIPIGVPVFSMMPSNPSYPKHWHGAVIPNNAVIEIEGLDLAKRPLMATADHIVIQDVKKVTISNAERDYDLLFDPDHNLEERILKEQFGQPFYN